MFFVIKSSFIEAFFVTYCDAAEWYQMNAQDPATPAMEAIVIFHNYLVFFIILIGTFVCIMLIRIVKKFNEGKNPVSSKFTHSSLLEVIWTIIPAFILLIIAIPSFVLLYSLDEYLNPGAIIKIIGHQWYWTYECFGYNDINTKVETPFLSDPFDSYISDVTENPIGFNNGYRLLEVDHRLSLPIRQHVRLLVTSADVLHCWAVPSFGVKIDACPGRVSHASLFIKRGGVYYGQCSEICGVNHGFMPIVVEVIGSPGFDRLAIADHILRRFFEVGEMMLKPGFTVPNPGE